MVIDTIQSGSNKVCYTMAEKAITILACACEEESCH